MAGDCEGAMVSSAVDPDVEVLGPAATGSQASRASCADLDLFSVPGGPPFIAVLLGVPRGRWTVELDGQQSACQKAKAAVSSLGGQSPLCASCPGVVSGVVAFRHGWRYVTGVASHEQTFALMDASATFHRKRSGSRFLEHEILFSARTPDGASCQVLDEAWIRGPADSGSRRMARDLAAGLSPRMSITKGDMLGTQHELQALLAKWRSDIGIANCELVAWPVDYRLAAAMASGRWWGDVSVKHLRQLPPQMLSK